MNERAAEPATDRAQQPNSALAPAVVVTGASEGIGLAIAHRFAAAGMPVLMIARRNEPLLEAARQVTRRSGTPAHALSLDVTVPDAGAQIDAALEAHGLYPDVLVNNAGIGLGGPFVDHEPAALQRLIDLNVRALSLLSHHVLPGMIGRGRGGVINIASLGGFAPGPWQAAYYASKAYVVSLSRALAYEVRGSGVRVSVVTPGPVETAFHARMGADTAPYRMLMPALSAEAVARATWRGWRLGFRVIQPGLLTPLLSLLMRITPWLLLVPLVGLLLGARYSFDASRDKT